MKRGWVVTLQDGTVMKESDYEWREVPKKAIKMISLLYDGRRWDLTGKEAYGVKTTASMVPGVKESFRVEKRTIYYYDGASKVCYNVEEDTGKFYMEVINTNET